MKKSNINKNKNKNKKIGTVILFSRLKELLADEINRQYLDKLRESGEWPETELQNAERAISVGTIKYGMLNHDTNKDIEFDLKNWTLSTGNTGPYLMYQYARIANILNKIEKPENVKPDFSLLNKMNEKEMLFELSRFQNVILQTSKDYNPSMLCNYLYDTAQRFSKWYSDKENSIKHCKDPTLQITRFAFAECNMKILKQGLKLLGIPVLERM